MAELLTLERRDDGVAVVTLANGKVNALSGALLAELRDAAGELTADPPGAVVVTGGERIFAAGADISEFGGPDEAGPDHRRLPRRARRRSPPSPASSSPPSAATRSAAAASWRWRATTASPGRGPCSGSPRSCSASSPAAAGRSAWPASSGRAGPRSCASPGARSRPTRRCGSGSPTRSSTATRRAGDRRSPPRSPAARSSPRRSPSGSIDAGLSRSARRRPGPRAGGVRRGVPHRGQPHRRGQLPRARPRQGDVHRVADARCVLPDRVTDRAGSRDVNGTGARSDSAQAMRPRSNGLARSGCTGTTRADTPWVPAAAMVIEPVYVPGAVRVELDDLESGRGTRRRGRREPCTHCTTTSSAVSPPRSTRDGRRRADSPACGASSSSSTDVTDTPSHAAVDALAPRGERGRRLAAVGRQVDRRRGGRLVQVGRVVAHHARRGHLRAERRPRLEHHRHPLARHAVATAVVEARHELVLEDAEQAARLAQVAPVLVGVVARPTRSPSRSVPSKHSSHQPSRMLQLSAPLSAAFMPDVPHASSGRRGVFSHTSQPWYIARAIEMS